MVKEISGKVVKGLGGLYEVITENEKIICRAKGSLHRYDDKILIGDDVIVTLDENTPDGVIISEIRDRKNSLIRPPLANLDYLFIAFAAKKPSPVLETVDKLVSIAEHNKILPVIIVTKSDISSENAEEYAEIYRNAGLSVFVTSSSLGEGVGELKEYIKENIKDGKTAAFAGASGVGKSTLLNVLFPSLSLKTQEISSKIERGRHTTRHVEIFGIGEGGFLADTPGFSLIDFARFDFFEIDELEATFREFLPYKGKCRYSDCSHVGEGEDECAIVRAVKEGKISQVRLDSYRAIYRVLKSRNKYEK